MAHINKWIEYPRFFYPRQQLVQQGNNIQSAPQIDVCQASGNLVNRGLVWRICCGVTGNLRGERVCFWREIASKLTKLWLFDTFLLKNLIIILPYLTNIPYNPQKLT